MVRVKGNPAKRKRRKKLFKQTKGYYSFGKNVYKRAKERYQRALRHAYKDRRRKKREFRALWQVKINAGVREHGLSYSKFIPLLKKSNINLDRKILADLAENEPEVFKKIVEEIKSQIK